MQPPLHDTVICVRAPLMAISARDGQIRGEGAEGFYLGDHRSLSRLLLTLNGREPMMLSAEIRDSSDARFIGNHREPGGDATGEPQFVVSRTRAVRDDAIRERIEIRNSDREPWDLRVVVELACSHADVDEVKAGGHGAPGMVLEVGPNALSWYSDRISVGRRGRRTPRTKVSVVPEANGVAVDETPEGTPATVGWFSWDVRLKPAESWTAELRITQPAPPRPFPFERPRHTAGWLAGATPARGATTRPIDRLLRNSLADLDALRLTESRAPRPASAGPEGSAGPAGEFTAAGAPWYLTLFGRDSLWTARMLLPIERGLALGTLTMLSRYQGAKDDGENDERPGKILHEMRGGPTSHGGALSLPPVYYGSVDATLLFIILLVDTWRADRDDPAIRPLLPALRNALTWLEQQAADHDRGFVAYEPKPGQLSHQGWKDSPEAVTFASGRPADGPIALCEVQAYAYEAAVGAADLLEYAEGPAAAARVRHWRKWAARLKDRFRDAFWVDDAFGRYPAIALDRDLAQVDGPSSNIGHLLAGGLLDDAEAREVTGLLLADGLDSGWGIRTRSSELASYNPFGYHCGSVWPHDTAITILGLLRRDPDAAAALAERLLEASAAFGHRLPELFAGIGRHEALRPVPVRGACLPQAWSSASAVVIAQALGALAHGG